MAETNAVIERVKQIIDNDVRPFIEMDGGTIEFIRYEENVVYVRLAGACGACPSSTLTLKGGVERAIRRRIPEVRSVEMDGLHTPAPSGANELTMIQL
jgi:NFU1 iron-sulfur cluster scaffold homolog, mitochondrial